MKKLTFIFLAIVGMSLSGMAQTTPTPGETETFNVCDGTTTLINQNDLFTDPGGVGGDCVNSDTGTPGDYPNCGCTTVTTICAPPGETISLNFLTFKVFLGFDTFTLYDGTTTGGPVLYDSEAAGGDDLATMVASTGGTSFSSTGQCLTIEMTSTTVVNFCGYDAEVTYSGSCGDEPPAAIPTLGQWGIMILMLSLFAFGVGMVYASKRKYAM